MGIRKLINWATWLGLFVQAAVGFSRPSQATQYPRAIGRRLAYIPDPQLANQEWFKMLHLGNSWEIATGKGIMITACAPGYYVHESELQANLLYPYRFDLANRTDSLSVDDGKFTFHGTAAAAIMVAELNGMGTNGIAFEAKLAPLQNFNYVDALDDIGKEEATADCVNRAMLNGKTKILVLLNQTPEGSSETYRRTRDAIAKATETGMTVVSSAGDSSRELLAEGDIDTGSIIVGALRENGTTANFSNWGRKVTISAVGENIFTLGGPNGKMRYFGGTAAAAAQVAAVVALVAEVNPRLTPRQIRTMLIETRIMTSLNHRVGGRIDAEAVVNKAVLSRNGASRPNSVEPRRRQRVLPPIDTELEK